MSKEPQWLTVERRDAPLLMSFPHTGTDIPEDYSGGLVSLVRARKDADWWIDELYAFARDLGASFIHTRISRTVIDVNRDPSGASLYPGQATTGLCPTLTFDGEPLYRAGQEPDSASIAARRKTYFEPYHEALASEISRLRSAHPRLVLYDCHSIRSVIPRLFEGTLPNFNIGTNSGASCAPELKDAVEAACRSDQFIQVVDGRFKGGWITRTYGVPGDGIHAIQMELACRGYMREQPGPVADSDWPTPWDKQFAAPIRNHLRLALEACLAFARAKGEAT
jgi:N-formylglutamate deformylase